MLNNTADTTQFIGETDVYNNDDMYLLYAYDLKTFISLFHRKFSRD